MVEKKEKKEEYVLALEEELLASIEREKKLVSESLSFKTFVAQKVKRSKLYKNIVSDPDSKMGKIVRAPRTLYRLVKNPEVRKSLSQKKTINDELIKDDDSWYFLEPWMINLKNRVEIAEKALKNKKKLALYFVEKPDSSTFRYRCYNTLEATKHSKKWQAIYFFKDEMDVVEKLLPKSSVLIFGRQSGQEKKVERLVKLAHKNKIKAGLDIDDLVFDMKYLNTMLDTIGEKVNRSYWVAYFASVQTMAKKMDFFVTTNGFLVKKLEESFKKPCRVIRNSMNREQINASLVYLKQKQMYKNERFTIGYFSGSPTHAKDFAVAEPEVTRFLEKHEDAVLNVVGYMRFSKKAERLIDEGRIKFLPFTDFRKLQRLISEVDVNIAPLLINDFTNCKSELKFFEAAVVETTTIASPTYTFRKSIKEGENGFLAQPGEWYKKLEYLYKHPEESKKIAKRARGYVLRYYYGKEFLKEVETTYDYFAK